MSYWLSCTALRITCIHTTHNLQSKLFTNMTEDFISYIYLYFSAHMQLQLQLDTQDTLYLTTLLSVFIQISISITTVQLITKIKVP